MGRTRYPGITPAQAGKRTEGSRYTPESEDHPRTSGEKVAVGAVAVDDEGSPPRRRGKVFLTDLVRVVVRITPAQAGKSEIRPVSFHFHRDHPRAGGEKAAPRAQKCEEEGSPPHRRGKGHACHQATVVVGITPAWAGKSSAARGCGKAHLDYPRMGGEKSISIRFAQDTAGSPPHRRGKVAAAGLNDLIDGITPAQAGKRRSGGTEMALPRDHPRAGGEKRLILFVLRAVTGSPPRGRGKGFFRRVDCLHGGITPAWAGKSPASQPWSPPLWMMVIRPRP